VQFQSLFRELRSHMLLGVGKKFFFFFLSELGWTDLMKCT